MQTLKIYLAGGMGNLTFHEQFIWRNKLRLQLNKIESKYKLDIINPVEYYNFESIKYNSQREILEFDLYHVRSSNLIVVNFNDKKSIGTAMELVLAKELHIPVIGLKEDNEDLHPWLSECCTRICKSFTELIEHLHDFYLT